MICQRLDLSAKGLMIDLFKINHLFTPELVQENPDRPLHFT